MRYLDESVLERKSNAIYTIENLSVPMSRQLKLTVATE
jgi:hypothetical protein